ncbi:hypothetical protein Tco_0713180 [Tanacetum coccineum]
MDEDELVLIILGRPFLAMARSVIDVHEGKLSLRVGINHDGKWTKEEEEEDSNKALVVSFYPRSEPVEPLEWKAPDNQLKPSSVEPPKFELKELPKHLEYAFLQEDNQLPVVISSALSTNKKTRLLEQLGEDAKKGEETNLVLNLGICHFMVKEGIVLSHKVLGSGIEVDKVKIEAISKLPYPTNVKAIRSFLGHASFYRRCKTTPNSMDLQFQDFEYPDPDKKGSENLARSSTRLEKLQSREANQAEDKGL